MVGLPVLTLVDGEQVSVLLSRHHERFRVGSQRRQTRDLVRHVRHQVKSGTPAGHTGQLGHTGQGFEPSSCVAMQGVGGNNV